MPGQQTNFRVAGSPVSQPGDVRSDHQTVEPGRREGKVCVRWQSIATLKEPAVAVLDSHPTMAAGVAEEGDEIHLRREWKPQSLKTQPLLRGLVVEDPGWPMHKIGPIVAQLEQAARMEHGLILASVYVDLGVREIGKAASVVEMEVGHHDVLDRFGLVPQARELADSGVLGIVREAQDPPEEADQRPWGQKVVEAQARIDEDESLVGVDEQARRAHVPAWVPGSHRRAIEYPNAHELVFACCAACRSGFSSVALSRFRTGMGTRSSCSTPGPSRHGDQRSRSSTTTISSSATSYNSETVLH